MRKPWWGRVTERQANAYRHGAQSRPPKPEIYRYLERILGRKPSHFELLDPQPEIAAALHLADCEARLDRAHAHYIDMQNVERLETFDVLQEQLEDLMYFKWVEDEVTREAARRIMRLEQLSKQYANDQKRLAGRYLREAQSKRDQALLEYMEYA